MMFPPITTVDEWRRVRPELKKLAKQRVRRCPYCKEMIRRSSETLDHIVPKAKGGRNSKRNLTVVCRSCNQRKADAGPFDLLVWSLRVILTMLIVRVKGGIA